MQQKSRSVNSAKNIIWGYAGTVLNLLLAFISRTVFINVLGTTYLGINGLFTNVLNILSFSELGIGTAMNYSLYKPVAEDDKEKIKSLMHVYKKAYRIVAAIVATVGLILLPFLRYFIKGAEGVANLQIYYLIFLFNTISSYFVSYKYGLVNAEQQNYILTNIDSVCRIVITIVQIIALELYHNFLVYLLVQAGLQLVQKIITALYLDKRYEYLRSKDVKPLDKKTKNNLIKNIKALILHKIGDISVYQTDNIIISAFINVAVVGLVSNYNIIISAATGFITVAMTGIVSSCGNLIATENKDKQFEVFNVYDFCGFWLYSFETIALVILFQPFITLWIGADKKIDNISLALILFNNYFVGQRAAVFNFKSAGGLFDPDKYASIIQAILNLIISIVCVIKMGLPGVYVGTIVSGIVITIWKPIVLYKYLFHKSSISYFIRMLRNLAITFAMICLLELIKHFVMSTVTILNFILMALITFIVPNVIYIFIFHRNSECKVLLKTVKFLKGRLKSHDH
ncbi:MULTISPECIES: lipopolysaccharide biosynthesis protein [Caproicibacterium]|uniref:Oligosaccharide flippase family protein n=1 Tax=Caproicibacterium lactatifermentans TaxID=2666138 RepID=A0A859DPR6_9FIRM|nr:oligosaccharide flippase family protein [Caproicibacterium lactatifermentans]QKN23696.1 oligosaccharide flippase family protein [Caproicibacterium lactatifermentans]